MHDRKFSARILLTGLLWALLVAATISVESATALATITQGDLSIYGNFREQWAGRWGEGSAVGGTPTTFGPTGSFGLPASKTGGSFDFNHWDLVEAKSVADIRPSYHFIKNYQLLGGRIDTLFIKDADLSAIYRAWYDAFPDIKTHGVAPAATDWPAYNRREKKAEFQRDDLREYYAQVNVSDALSFRIGKQQVIWTEADALSGSEVINPQDFRFHFIHFEAAEELRIPIQMVKMTYNLGDHWKTSNNELEAFWIPGDFQAFDASGFRIGIVPPDYVDARNPYAIRAVDDVAAASPFFNSGFYNMEGQPVNIEGTLATSRGTFHDEAFQPLVGSAGATNTFLDFSDRNGRRNTPNRSLDHSEFGVRYSTLLPIGNGLQVSLIYQYLYRAVKTGIDQFAPPPACIAAATCLELVGPDRPAGLNFGPGIFGVVNVIPGTFNQLYANRPGGLPATSPQPIGGTGPLFLAPGVPFARGGFFVSNFFSEYQRASFTGLTGTYYDKDLTDVVYRYDLSYRVKTGFYESGPGKTLLLAPGADIGKWSDQFTGIIAFDRPTYIPWISKQHTFIVAQWTTNFFPSVDGHTVPNIADAQGKQRKFQNIPFVATVNWLMDGRLVTNNVLFWDLDDTVGFLSTTNTYRYSKNVLFGANAVWYLGRSGRFTDPLTLSRDQRINELEFRLTYEL